jgi:hypothetical protein
LPIKREQAIAQLFCESDINRITAADAMVGGNGSCLTSER